MVPQVRNRFLLLVAQHVDVVACSNSLPANNWKVLLKNHTSSLRAGFLSYTEGQHQQILMEQETEPVMEMYTLLAVCAVCEPQHKACSLSA